MASANIWRAPRAQRSSNSAISFDGDGYLFVEQFADNGDFVQSEREMAIITRPNEERDGLVMYAYDEAVSETRSMSVLIVRFGQPHMDSSDL